MDVLRVLRDEDEISSQLVGMVSSVVEDKMEAGQCRAAATEQLFRDRPLTDAKLRIYAFEEKGSSHRKALRVGRSSGRRKRRNGRHDLN